MFLLICFAAFIAPGCGSGQTQCEVVSSSHILPVASLCYKSSVKSKNVVLDGFLTYNSSAPECRCNLTSTRRTNVSLTALDSLQPGHNPCWSTILVENENNNFVINCHVWGNVAVSDTENATFIFFRPQFGYKSNHCIFFNPGKGEALHYFCVRRNVTNRNDFCIRANILNTLSSLEKEINATNFISHNSNAILTLSCDGDPYIITKKNEHPTETDISNIWKYTIPVIGVLTLATILAAWYKHRKSHKTLDNEEYDARDLDNQINLPYSSDYGRESNRTSSQSSHIYDTIYNLEHARNDATVSDNDGNCEPSIYDVPVNTSVYEMYLTPGEITVETEQVAVIDPVVYGL